MANARRWPWTCRASGASAFTKFPDGFAFYVRLPEEAEVGEAFAEWKGKSQELKPISLYEYAKMQVSDIRELYLTQENAQGFWVPVADCKSLVAFEERIRQREALVFAAKVVARLLETYHKVNGSYPTALVDLWQGDSAVSVICPLSPYHWPEPLCGPNSLENPVNGLKYYPLYTEGDDSKQTTGYLLGVLDSGDSAAPPLVVTDKLLPEAIEWFWSAPDPLGHYRTSH